MRQLYIFLIMLAMVFFSSSAFACKLVFDPRPLTERINDYDTAFIGKVMDVKSEAGTGNSEAEFLVMAPVKGKPLYHDEVKVSSNMGSCSHRFEKGQIWLITTSGSKTPYETNVTAATTLIEDNRGLQAGSWGPIKPLLTTEALQQLSQDHACINPVLALDSYLETLSRTCQNDNECAGYYINPFPCQQAVIMSKDAYPADTTTLESLQKNIRESCSLKQELIPACEPFPFEPVCHKGKCMNKSMVKD